MPKVSQVLSGLGKFKSKLQVCKPRPRITLFGTKNQPGFGLADSLEAEGSARYEEVISGYI
ncbi:MAG: hypothetical protein GX811_12040 [Lentisphaerae bacterium]|nr:hypothetical protein [Lentisphaerota bacterium]